MMKQAKALLAQQLAEELAALSSDGEEQNQLNSLAESERERLEEEKRAFADLDGNGNVGGSSGSKGPYPGGQR